MPMYNLINYSKNFRKTKGSFWNCYPDKPNSGYSAQPDGQADNRYERRKIFYSIRNSESFDYKNKLIGNLPENDNEDELDMFINIRQAGGHWKIGKNTYSVTK